MRVDRDRQEILFTHARSQRDTSWHFRTNTTRYHEDSIRAPIMSYSDHRLDLINQLLQIALWAININIFTLHGTSSSQTDHSPLTTVGNLPCSLSELFLIRNLQTTWSTITDLGCLGPWKMILRLAPFSARGLTPWAPQAIPP